MVSLNSRINRAAYDSNKNYIGNADWQYKITGIFYKQCSGINYSAWVHDGLYGDYLYKEYWMLNQFILKFLFDLVFLIMGFFRCLKNLQLHGCVLIIVLWLILVVSSPLILKDIKRYQKSIKQNGR